MPAITDSRTGLGEIDTARPIHSCIEKPRRSVSLRVLLHHKRRKGKTSVLTVLNLLAHLRTHLVWIFSRADQNILKSVH
jgi:hypothetical protein